MISYFENVITDIGDHWLIYVTMPFIAALIGYLTKLVAVEMMFRPLEFRGVRPFLGWQGVIPRYAPRMAVTAVDLMLDRLIDPQELMDRVDPDELVRSVQGPLIDITDQLTRELMAKYYPTLWEALPEAMRRIVVGRVQKEAPALIEQMMADLRGDIDKVFDLRTMAIEALVRDRALLVRLVRDIGSVEMRFIVKSGSVFGFALGFAQALIWAGTHQAWLMPAFGFFVGYFTDWLALNLIFRPMEPRRFLGIIRWQGLFHQRREQVATDYGDLIAAEIMSPHNIIEAMLTGPQSDRLLALIDQQIRATVEKQAGLAKPLVVLSMGGRRFQEMKDDAARIALERFPEAAREVEDYAMEALDVRALVKEKMVLMTPLEYEGLLRPAFKQDEWKLVLIGGLLGGVIGELQVLLLLH